MAKITSYMKKILYGAVCLAVCALVACSERKPVQKPMENADTTGVAADAAQVAAAAGEEAISRLDAALAQGSGDPEKVRDVVADIVRKLQEFTETGQVEAAGAYAAQVKAYVHKYADIIKRVYPRGLGELEVANKAVSVADSLRKATKKVVVPAKQAGQAVVKAVSDTLLKPANKALKKAEEEARSTVDEAGKHLNEANKRLQEAGKQLNEENKRLQEAGKQLHEAVQ